ncbi:ABC transporter substrate-binding protein (plasmid) [Streptomyces sp. NBC_00841]|uniref:ABC transporter substrate-binding protein n=1 Tax=unclassified Streptomyces TaxID=2593676 RepID=UPI0022502B34|nr:MULTISPECIES: ABC transporter substrate-binding protein [unclassified Streptomyces]MCX4538950.1 ABC transporter substrate-binding protein [Streptomyces sp. NBC_01669]WSA04818.1 ABC transporter substrate-binding protein [Streptomyces sp. NBC_00841]
MARRLRLPTLAAAVALCVAGCAGGTPQAATAFSPTFTYSYHRDVVTDWDPATSYSNELIVLQNVYESLTRYDPATRTVKPQLATSWASSADGRTWTFHLRRGVRFHDGAPVTAQAAKAAIERTVAAQGGAAYIWDAVSSIDTPDPATLAFHLSYAAPMDVIASSDYGAYIYDTTPPGVKPGALKNWLEAGHDTGTGPYTVAAWNQGQEAEVTLNASTGYWAGWSGRHYRQIVFNHTPDVTTAWQTMETGEVNFVAQLNPELFKEATHFRSLATQATPSLQNMIAFFNTAAGPLKDVRLRQAVQNAINYDGLLAALHGSVGPAQGLIPSGLPGNDPSLTRHQNLSLARKQLAEAGYGPGGKHLTLNLTYAQGDDAQQLLVTLLSSDLQGLNITLDARPMQWNAQWAQAKSADPAHRQDILLMYWYADYASAYGWFINLFHSAQPVSFNLSYLDDPVVDREIDAIPQLTATDPAAARANYALLQRQLLEQHAAAAPLFVNTYQRVYASGITGYRDNPAYPDVVFVYDLEPSP